MSKITQNYIEARRDGIKWLNSQKRDYSTGVNILTRSGYKGFVAARLARQGEKPHTREKLEYEIRQMIKVWYHRMTRALRMWTWQMMQCRAMTGVPRRFPKRRLPPLSPLRRGNWRVRRTNSPPILR